MGHSAAVMRRRRGAAGRWRSGSRANSRRAASSDCPRKVGEEDGDIVREIARDCSECNISLLIVEFITGSKRQRPPDGGAKRPCSFQRGAARGGKRAGAPLDHEVIGL